MHRGPGRGNRQRPNSNGSSPTENTLIDGNVVIGVITPAAIFITLANGAVLWLIIRRRNLQRLRNMPLLSLALADLIIGVSLGPTAIAMHALPGNIHICKAHLVLEVFCFTASLLNMFVASVERWIAIFRPLKYARYINPHSVWKMIGAAWIATIIITLLMTCFRCGVNRRYCMWKGTSGSVFSIVFYVLFLILSLIMGLIQIRIYRVVRYHSRRIAPAGRARAPSFISSEDQRSIATISNFKASIFSRRRSTMNKRSLPQPQQETSNRVQRIMISSRQQNDNEAVTAPDIVVEYQGQLKTIENGISINTHAKTRVSVKGQCSRSSRAKQREGQRVADENNKSVMQATVISSCNCDHDEEKLTVTAQSSSVGQTTTTSMEKRVKTRNKRNRSQSYQQHSTASAVSILYMVFILMWTPYLIFAMLCSLKVCRRTCIQGHYITRLILLFNSAVNPLIFTIRIQEFRRALKDFICGRS